MAHTFGYVVFVSFGQNMTKPFFYHGRTVFRLPECFDDDSDFWLVVINKGIEPNTMYSALPETISDKMLHASEKGIQIILQQQKQQLL